MSRETDRVTEFVECQCRALDHVVKFEYEHDGVFNQFYIYMMLNPRYRFWRRIWLAIKFVLNWDYPVEADAMIKNEDVLRIRNLCEKYLEGIDITKFATKAYARKWKPYNDPSTE
jgi:hypothetical protein